MPEQDEDYRDSLPPLETRGGRGNAVMQDEEEDSSPQDEQSASSAESELEQEDQQEQVEEKQEQDVPFHKHPRWQEIQAEREELRRQNQQLLEMARAAIPQHKPTAKDPWDGLINHPDPATAQFYQQMQAVVRAERQAAKQEAVAELSPVIDAGRQELARLNIREFRRENPEIKPGSEEESMIVSYMEGKVDGTRYNLETAKKLALYERLERENKELKTKKAVTPKKVAANVESSNGIPERSGLPNKRGDWRKEASELYDKGLDIRDIASSVFGKKRR